MAMNIYHCLMGQILFFVVYAFCYALIVPKVALNHHQKLLEERSQMPPQMWAALGDD